MPYRDHEHSFSIPVDLVAFHGVARADQKIAWPPEGDFVMNVARFEEALVSALTIEVESDLLCARPRFRDCSFLKLIAWLGRSAVNAAVIFRLFNSYAFTGNEDRLYDQEHEILEAVRYDLALAGTHLLAADAAPIIHGEAAQQIHARLTSEEQIIGY